MAIIIRGKTACHICQKTIQEGDSVVAFPAFVWNQRDPIFGFSDAACHAECFHRHPSAQHIQARYEELQKRVGPGRRVCSICHNPIMNPNEYLMIGHFTDDPKQFLHHLNYAQYHRACFSKWNQRERLIEKIRELEQSGKWGGDSLLALLADLTAKS